MKHEEQPFRPDKRNSGVKSTESTDAVFTWFGPVDAPKTRFRYAVVKEEDGVLSIQPGEGRFKSGLKAVRYDSQDAEDGAEWVVVKTRPTRIDLKQAGE